MNVGEVWIVDFPYEDDPTKSKIRPCIIIDIEDELLVLSIKVTTHESRDEYDVPIFKWREANLLNPSYARVSKVLLFNKESFIKKCGTLSEMDFENIKRAFVRYYSSSRKY
ncbi:MAG: type II toxin-antitoxin system PemK/MazF family toxin [Peptococcia bacterium]|jgi:mRNA interferase MazF